MAFTDESELEKHLRRLIGSKITTKYPNVYALDNKKAVDIVICRDGTAPALFFLEVKLHQESHGRMGIGAGKGGGYQPEIITRHPAYFETHLRWVIVDSREAAEKYLFVPTNVVSQYLAGTQLGSKQNNIQLRIFKEVEALDENGLVDALSNWLLA